MSKVGPRATTPAPSRGNAANRDFRILVVDDNEMNVELLAATLGRLGYDVDSALDGADALAAIERRMPDVLLMDVLMPGVSGLDVLKTLRGRDVTADLPVILISGLGETDDIVDGLRLGANDYVTKPIDMPVLQARLATQTALKRARDDLKTTASLLASEIERHQQELQIAAHVQRMILPRSSPATGPISTAWCYEPATEVGGDLLDIIDLPGGRTMLFVADAMGHGVQAALVAAIVKASLVARLDTFADDLPALMTHLDESVGSLFNDRFVTAAACVVDLPAGRIRYASAGHPPILLKTPEGVRSLSIGNLPLGTQMGLGYTGGEVDLIPGSILLLYSDGLTEASGPSGRQWGSSALVEALASTPPDATAEDVSDALRRLIDDFRGPVPLADDLTILAAAIPG